MKIPSALLIMLMVPLGAAAQTVADSFQQLEGRLLLREGDTILITYAQDGGDDHAVVRGTFVRLTGPAITLQPDSGAETEIAESNVRRIVRERKDTVWKGAFIGAAVGGGIGGAFAAAYCSGSYCRNEEAGVIAAAIAIYAGIGFAVGAGIDAAHGKPQMELVYLESPPATGSMTLSVSPILSRRQKGVRVTVTW